MVIYTDQSGLDKTTTILSPSKLMTKSLGVVDYGEKRPRHSALPLGVVSLSVEDLSGVKTESNYYKPVYQDVIDANTPGSQHGTEQACRAPGDSRRSQERGPPC